MPAENISSTYVNVLFLKSFSSLVNSFFLTAAKENGNPYFQSYVLWNLLKLAKKLVFSEYLR